VSNVAHEAIDLDAALDTMLIGSRLFNVCVTPLPRESANVLGGETMVPLRSLRVPVAILAVVLGLAPTHRLAAA
jgi:hypothetical protein